MRHVHILRVNPLSPPRHLPALPFRPPPCRRSELLPLPPLTSKPKSTCVPALLVQEKTINNLRKSNATLTAERKALETQIQIFRAGRQPSPAAAAPAAAAAAAHSQRPKGPAVPSDPEPAAASRAKRGSASMLIVPSAAVDIDGSSSDEEDQPPSGTKVGPAAGGHGEALYREGGTRAPIGSCPVFATTAKAAGG